MKQLIFEAFVVGILAAIFGFVISTAIMFLNPEFSFEKYKFWPQVLISYFLTGVLLHFAFEFAGANAWYCNKGYACLQNQ